jgi:transcriptional regulator with XRE-family HTH domain
VPRASVDANLARVLRDIREDRGMSQEDVAHAAAITLGSYSRIELGRASPAWTTVGAIAAALGMRLSDLARAVEEAS